MQRTNRASVDPRVPVGSQQSHPGGGNLARAAERREAAIRDAAALGLSRRAIAQMTGLSHTRVIQILNSQTRRAETVEELEGLQGPELADKLLSLVYSNSMSREEMADATGIPTEAVNTMIREHAEMLAQRRHVAALKHLLGLPAGVDVEVARALSGDASISSIDRVTRGKTQRCQAPDRPRCARKNVF